MVLTGLQRRIMACLAANRSDTSYVAGGLVLNKDWPRMSEDIDIFHDTDEDIGPAAARDIAALRARTFMVRVDIEIYGVTEATVSEYGEETKIQWMSETRHRFLPLIRDDEWGARLAPADLAVNKVLAASTRRKARDMVDVAVIGDRLCPLGPLAMAAGGKSPFFSPIRTIESIRRNGLSIADDEFDQVQGIPSGWSYADIRERLIALLDAAEVYVMAAPLAVAGRLALSHAGIPVEVSDPIPDEVELRAATEEPEVLPQIKDTVSPWPGIA